MIGTSFFGKVDQVGDRCCVETLFFCVVVPLIPLRSYAVVPDKELVSPKFLTEVVAGVSIGGGRTRTAVPVPLSFKSVLMTYVRAVLWVVHGVGTALWLLFFFVGAALPKGGEEVTVPFVLRHLWLMLPYALPGALGGGLLWWSYWVTRASPERAAELLGLLELPERTVDESIAEDVPNDDEGRFRKQRRRFRRGSE